MYYNFPIINTINDVLPHIEGRSEFVVADRLDHVIINYNVAFAETFAGDPSADVGVAIRRECRGITFDKETGNIIRRPFHKFFNLNEREELQDNMPEVQEHMAKATLLDKLDGSMIAPFYRANGIICWGTKMGDTETADQCEDEVVSLQHAHFVRDFLDIGVTPIFEYVSPNNRIVVEYEEPNLILTAMRNMVTGQYMSYDILCVLAVGYGIDVVKQETYDKNRTDYEGVIAVRDGHMIKLKAEPYVRLHKMLDLVRYERNVVALILNNQVDDVIGMSPGIRTLVYDTMEMLSGMMLNIGEVIMQELEAVKLNNLTRKDIGLNTDMHPLVKGAIFKLFDIEGPYLPKIAEYVTDQMLKATTSNTKWDEFVNAWKKAVLEYRKNSE